LGEQVQQAGSAVGPDKLRFDFSHTKAVSPEELSRVEDIVNRKIIENHPVKAFTTTMDYARDMGVIALFDEKYGDFVRVIEVGDFSRELCGGTHVTSTAQIGAFKIVSESSVGANLRRIEAITSKGAIEYFRDREKTVVDLSSLLKTDPARLAVAVNDLLAEQRQLRVLAREASSGKLGELSQELAGSAEDRGGVRILATRAEVETADELMELGDILAEQLKPAAIILAAELEGKVVLMAKFADQAVEQGAKAGDLIRETAGLVGGKGGGRPGMARGGGPDVADIDAAVERSWQWLREKIPA
jgi:alanyl-tRNA synthetase